MFGQIHGLGNYCSRTAGNMFGRVSGSCGEILEKSGGISGEIQGMKMRFYENFGAWGWDF